MVKLSVVANKVAIDPVGPGVDKTAGGIFLPDSVKENYEHNGVIVAVGPDADKRLTPGAKVVYDPKSGTRVTLSGDSEKEYRIMRDIDLLYFFEEQTEPARN